MKKIVILIYCSVFMLTGLATNLVIAAADHQFLIQTCQSMPEPEVLQKRRREAGDVDEIGDSSRAGRVAFKRKIGRAGRVAFKRKIGRAGRVAFKRKIGRAGRVAFKRKIGRASRVAFKRKIGRAGRVAFKRKIGRGNENTIIVEKNVGEAKIRLPVIIAPLAPQSTGLTMTDQPTLYWYMSSKWQYEMGFTLNELGASEPLLEHDINLTSECQPHLQGDFICHLNLADHQVRLQPNREYEWFVFIIFDPEQRTSDWLASALIRYEPPSKPLLLEPTLPPYQVYHNAGIWYDGFDQLMTQIQNQPYNQTVLTAASHLLAQEKMRNVAEYMQKGCRQECYYEIEAES